MKLNKFEWLLLLLLCVGIIAMILGIFISSIVSLGESFIGLFFFLLFPYIPVWLLERIDFNYQTAKILFYSILVILVILLLFGEPFSTLGYLGGTNQTANGTAINLLIWALYGIPVGLWIKLKNLENVKQRNGKRTKK
jgi:hypothetical protein